MKPALLMRVLLGTLTLGGEKCDSRRRKRLHSSSHKDTLPPRGAPSLGSQRDPGGQDLPFPLKFCHAHCEARTVLGKRTLWGRDEGPTVHGPGG